MQLCNWWGAVALVLVMLWCVYATHITHSFGAIQALLYDVHIVCDNLITCPYCCIFGTCFMPDALPDTTFPFLSVLETDIKVAPGAGHWVWPEPESSTFHTGPLMPSSFVVFNNSFIIVSVIVRLLGSFPKMFGFRSVRLLHAGFVWQTPSGRRFVPSDPWVHVLVN